MGEPGRLPEAKPREDAAQLRFIADNVPTMSVAYDQNLLCVFANRRFAEFFGLTTVSAVGKHLREIVGEGPYREIKPYFDRVLRGHRVTYKRTRVLDSGELRYLEVDLIPNIGQDGCTRGLFAVTADVTERKQAQKTQARLAAIVDGSNDAIISRSVDRKILSWNAAAERLFGYTAAEVIGQSVTLIIPPEREQESVRNRAPLAQGLAVLDLETERLAKGGQRVAVSLSQFPIKDEDGTVTGVATIFRNIQERKQAEQRQTMEHTVTRILAEADAPEDAMPRIIRTICETMGWHCGARWVWDKEAMLLRCREMWGIDTPEIREFITASANGTIKLEPAGQGLVRRTYASGQPIWIADVTQVKGLLKRASMVTKAGLHGAFGFPLRLGDEVLGVMEFFHRDAREPDALLLRIAESIGNQIGQFMARRQAEERIRHLANYDELTGLPNRSMFQERLHHALAQAQRHARPLAVLFIDLDQFKNINDTLGHEAGDRVLKEVAERLRGCLRESDTVGRFGGDEFVVLIEGLPQLADVAAVAQKILDAAARPFMLAAQEFQIGASIGISAFPEDGKDLLNLLKNADAAMYRAKERGKNNYQFYSVQMTALSSTKTSD